MKCLREAPKGCIYKLSVRSSYSYVVTKSQPPPQPRLSQEPTLGMALGRDHAGSVYHPWHATEWPGGCLGCPYLSTL